MLHANDSQSIINVEDYLIIAHEAFVVSLRRIDNVTSTRITHFEKDFIDITTISYNKSAFQSINTRDNLFKSRRSKSKDRRTKFKTIVNSRNDENKNTTNTIDEQSDTSSTTKEVQNEQMNFKKRKSEIKASLILLKNIVKKVKVNDEDELVSEDSNFVKKDYRVKNSIKSTIDKLKYNINHYVAYDLVNNDNVDESITHAFVKFENYDHYALYMNSKVFTIEEFLKQKVRFDDFWIVVILSFELSSVKLFKYWSIEFDKNDMIRDTRVSLDYAAKMWIDDETMNVNEVRVEFEKDDYYYKWWRELHSLMSKKKLNAKLYEHRSSHEKFKCENFDFKITYRAINQSSKDQKNLNASISLYNISTKKDKSSSFKK